MKKAGISKNLKSYIRSLQIRKFRQAEQTFLVQGGKAVKETLSSDYRVVAVAGTEKFLDTLSESEVSGAFEIWVATEDDLAAAGSFETNNSALAIVKMKDLAPAPHPVNEYFLVLDDIRDPGNLGTIIRTADWYGIKHIIASETTADVYNPKVISASMGSFLRVGISYTSLVDYLAANSMPVYGAFLKGENVHQTKFGPAGFIVIGNESNGISPVVEKKVTHRITIPANGNAESLNASVSTGVILDNLRRKL